MSDETEKIPTETERRAEIDMRVGALLAKREAEQFLYRRGFWDCLYLVMILVSVTFIFWPEISAVIKVKGK